MLTTNKDTQDKSTKLIGIHSYLLSFLAKRILSRNLVVVLEEEQYIVPLVFRQTQNPLLAWIHRCVSCVGMNKSRVSFHFLFLSCMMNGWTRILFFFYDFIHNFFTSHVIYFLCNILSSTTCSINHVSQTKPILT